MNEIKARADLTLSQDFQRLLTDMSKFYNTVQQNAFDKSGKDRDISRTVSLVSGTYTSSFFKVLDVKTFKTVNIYLTVTALSGTSPSLKIKIFDYLKGEKFYLAEFEEFTSLSATQTRRIELSNLGKFLYVEVTISDTCTFKIDAIGKIA